MAEYKVHHFTTRDSNDRWQIVDKVGREYVAKQFNVNYSYEINEYCIYNNALYKFIQNHNAGIWNNQHVILCANLASELTSIKNDINNSNNNINTLSGEITNIQNEVRSSISDVMDRVDDAKDEIEDDVRDSINVVVTDWLDLHVNTDEGQTSIVDDTLTIQGAAADAKAAGDAISALSVGLSNSLLSNDIKQTLLLIVSKIAFLDGDMDYYNLLNEAFYPSVVLDSISVVYTQTGTVYDTDSIESLEDDLIVTAYYSDSTSSRVMTGYTMSGTLTPGTSTITVTYGNKTAEFDVTVTEDTALYRIAGSELMVGYATSNTRPNYYNTSEKRLSYLKFDLLLTGGKTYKFTVDTDMSTANIGLQFYTQTALNSVNNSTNIASGEIYDPGWQPLTTTIFVPEKQNSHNIVGVRFTFRKDSSDSAITSNFVNMVVIEEVSDNA